MGVETARTQRRWLLAAGGIAALCAVPVLIGAWPVSAQAMAPVELRARILAADTPYSGYAESDGSLGLPDLPEVGDVGGLFGGRTHLRVWRLTEERSRVDVLTPNGERGFYRVPGAAAAWDFESNVTTLLYGEPDLRLPRAADLVPPDLARRLLGGRRGPEALAAIPPRRVAGVSAPGLRLVPADPETRIGQVDVWADPVTGVALEVQVTGRDGGPPSLTTRFLDLRQGAGAVTGSEVEVPFPAGGEQAATQVERISDVIDRFAPAVLPAALLGRAGSGLADGGPRQGRALRAYGQGFSMFVAASLPRRYGSRAYDAARSAGARPVTLADGEAVLLQTALLSLVITLPTAEAPGFVLAGPVSADLLTRAASELVASVQPYFVAQ